MEHYVYEELDGSPIRRVTRRGNKSFSQSHPDGDNGRWVSGAGDGARVPYHLPEVNEAIEHGDPVYITEGEKDVNTARLQGVAATCNIGGAGKWRDSDSWHLRGAEPVIIIWDRDEAGRRHALSVEASLRRSGIADIRFARAARGKDLTDHIESGLTIDQLVFRRPKLPQEERVEAVVAQDDEKLPSGLRVILLLSDAKPEGGKQFQWNGVCSAHRDTRPSLSIALGSHGQTLLKCQAGCSFEAIADGFGVPLSDLTRHRTTVDTPVIKSLDDYKEKSVDWIWHGRLPLGSLVIVDGDPDQGKSTIFFDLIARITSGGWFPDDSPVGEPRSCLVMTSEDSIEQRVKPMLRVAGGVGGRVLTHALPRDENGQVVPFAIPDNIPQLESTIAATGVSLVMIDPIMGFLGEKIHTGIDASVRRAIGPLADVAERYGVCIVGIRHLKKDAREKSPMYRGGGSIAFIGQARVGMMVGPMPGGAVGERVLAVHKGNLVRAGSVPSLGYTIEGAAENEDIPVVSWSGVVGVSAADILGSGDARRETPVRDEAVEFIDLFLSEEHAGVSMPDFTEACRGAGVSLKTMRAAFAESGHHKWQHRSGGRIAGWWVHHKSMKLKGCARCRRQWRVVKSS